MIKNYKFGISLIALLATIVITLILISTIVISTKNIMEDTSKRSFAKEIYLIKQKVDEYKFRNAKYPMKQDISINVDGLDASGREQFANEPGYGTGSITLKEINLYEAGVETVTRGTKKDSEYDVYALSQTTGKVYYLKGYKVGSTTYYTLTDGLLKMLDMSK